MEHYAGRRSNGQRAAFRNGMRDRDEFEIERAEREALPLRHDFQRDFRRAGLREPARLQQTRGETRAINLATQSRPKRGDRAFGELHQRRL